MKIKIMQAAVLAVLLPAFVAGCSPSVSSARAAAPAVTQAPVAARVAAPDFSQLAEQAGPAVVNISVTQKAVAAVEQELPFDRNDPMYEFFKRFGFGQGGQIPRQAPRRLEPEAAHEAAAAVDLEGVAASVVAELEPLAEAKGVELRLERVAPAYVTGQAQALHNLARNLLDNAIRYTPAGGRVTLQVRTQDGKAVLHRAVASVLPSSSRSRTPTMRRFSLGEADQGKGLRVTVRFRAINPK